MSNVGTIPVEMLLPLYQHSGNRNYVGRHRVTKRAPVAVRAARRVVHEWTKPRAWTTAIGENLAYRLSDDSAEKVYDLLTGQTFHDVSAKVARTWRTMDRAAYGAIPATWRHRLEARARARAAAAQQRDDTEAWWISRSADYPILIPTQAMHIIEETTSA